jgi:hypothetical protein
MGQYTFVGHTASGAPYYNRQGSGYYIYWDPNCNGATSPPRWILDNSAPSITATSDLDNDGSCRYVARIHSLDKSTPPFGSNTWAVACISGQGLLENILTIAHPDPPYPPGMAPSAPPMPPFLKPGYFAYLFCFLLCVLLLACFGYRIWKMHKAQAANYATEFGRKQQRRSKLAMPFLLAFGSLGASLLAAVVGWAATTQQFAQLWTQLHLQEGVVEIPISALDWLNYCFKSLEPILFGLFLITVSPKWVAAAIYATGGISATRAAASSRRLFFIVLRVVMILVPLSFPLAAAMAMLPGGPSGMAFLRLGIGLNAAALGWEVLLWMALLGLACGMRSITKSSMGPTVRERVREVYCCLGTVCTCLFFRGISRSVVLGSLVRLQQAYITLAELSSDLDDPTPEQVEHMQTDLSTATKSAKAIAEPAEILMDISGLVACIFVFRDMMRVARRNAQLVRKVHREDATFVPQEGGPGTKDITNGYPPIKIGTAPSAPRPDWLPLAGKGQAHVEPTCWSLSIANYLRLVQFCRGTSTWAAIAKAKGGEENITMCTLRAAGAPILLR